MYKLIALDIDGTLLDPQGQIRPRVRAAVAQAVVQGCIVTLATGRRHRSARQVAADLGIAVPLIMYSGGIVYDPATESALLHRPLPAEFVRATVAMLRRAGLGAGLLQSPLRGEKIYLGPPEYDDPYLHDYATHPERAELVMRHPYDEMASVADPMVVFTAGSGLTNRQISSLIAENPDLECKFYGYSLRHRSAPDLHGFDLLPPGHSKAVALQFLAEHFGLELSETMVIGDSFNDIEMLQAAGLGVAMGNAFPEVKAVAGVVVASNAEDGVAEAIERFVLGD